MKNGSEGRRQVKIDFVDFWHPNTREAKENNPLFKLLSTRFDLEIAERPDFLLYSCMGTDFLRYRCVRIFYTGENVRPKFRECDFAFSFDYPTTERNYRLPHYRLYPQFARLTDPKDVDAILATKSKFCNFVYSNSNAAERIDFFHLLSKYRRVDSGGRHLNNIGGPVEDKVEFMRPYKFSIAFENSSYPGYVTEKIMHAMAANTVAIYWGDPLIARNFNPDSFINCHDYDNFDQVIERVIELDQNDELYRRVLSAPYLYENTVPGFLRDERILDRFEQIFSRTDLRPVATTWRNPVAQGKYALRRAIRRNRALLAGARRGE